MWNNGKSVISWKIWKPAPVWNAAFHLIETQANQSATSGPTHVRETTKCMQAWLMKIKHDPGNKKLGFFTCSSCSSRSRTNHHQNSWNAYQWNPLSTYITYPSLISPNSTHVKQIEQKQVSHINIQITITTSKLNENPRSKVHYNQ